jgi:hypothetical protein
MVVNQPTEVEAAATTSKATISAGKATAIGAGIAGVITGLLAVLGIIYQGSNQQDPSRAEFLREQRQTAYAAFYAAHTTLREAETFYFGITRQVSVDGRDIAGDMEAARGRMADEYGVVRIVGSPTAVTAAKALFDSHADWQSKVTDLILSRDPYTPAERAESDEGKASTATALGQGGGR